MSQITRCPSCATSFKVVADQLRISQGWVRCGHCAEIFDANQDIKPWVPTPPVLTNVVDEQQQVVFYPVQILTADNDGARVSGLPARSQIITQGAGFVRAGDKVVVAGAKP